MQEFSQHKAATIRRAQAPLRGRLRFSGDKSISIRRALLTIYRDDEVTLQNFGSGEDCLTALSCLERLGKRVTRKGRQVTIAGSAGASRAELDCGNSGTCARLLMGILAGREGEWRISGDESLSSRPMERVAAPLRELGAEIELTDGRLPARIVGRKLHSAKIVAQTASAQVKSAVLLAAVSSGTAVEYQEALPTRAHTENILALQRSSDGWIRVPEGTSISAQQLAGEIPGDPSSAAFWGVGGMLVPDSSLTLDSLLIADGRTGWIDALCEAGAVIRREEPQFIGGELCGTVTSASSRIRGIYIPRTKIPAVIDELPLLAVAATQAQVESVFEGVSELRHKESDRLEAILRGLRAMGAKVDLLNDTLRIEGSTKLAGAEIDSAGDHRIAMAFAIAGLFADGETRIHEPDCVRVSYPEFWDDYSTLTQMNPFANAE